MKPRNPKHQRILFGAAAGLVGGYLVGTHTAWLILAMPLGIVLLQHQMVRQTESVVAMGRLGFYWQIVASLAVLAAIGFLALRDVGVSLVDLGLIGENLATALGFGVMAGLSAALVMEAIDRLLRREETPLVKFVFPRTPGEKAMFVLVSLMAGFAEELVFRGFMIQFITGWFGSVTFAVLLSSLLFGLVHSYQRFYGVMVTGLFGLGMAGLYLWQDSLLLVMVAHATYDIFAGLFLGPKDSKGIAASG
ncbi:MAG: CPBP family intramembrane metalloprotease [Gemmatimonadales bacterium]|nr:CPBP family intramembrane metalloprotease [Gemmatimonadales bacterium]